MVRDSKENVKKIAYLHAERKTEALGIYCELLTFAVVEVFTPDSGNVALGIQQRSVGQHLSLCRRGRLHKDKVGDTVDSNTMMTYGGRCDLVRPKQESVFFGSVVDGWAGVNSGKMATQFGKVTTVLLLVFRVCSQVGDFCRGRVLRSPVRTRP
jgi:hypothetical protein